jgi:hypothetical protein
MAAAAEQMTTWVLACGHEIPRDPPANRRPLVFPTGLIRCPACHRPQVVTAASIRIENPARQEPRRQLDDRG